MSETVEYKCPECGAVVHEPGECVGPVHPGSGVIESGHAAAAVEAVADEHDGDTSNGDPAETAGA